MFFSFLRVVSDLQVTEATYVNSIYSIGSCIWSFAAGVLITTGWSVTNPDCQGLVKSKLGNRPDLTVAYIIDQSNPDLLVGQVGQESEVVVDFRCVIVSEVFHLMILRTLTLTLSVRKALSANQSAISPHARDLETSETSAIGQILIW